MIIIIGLLIGGILKGQELVESARVTSTVGQIKGMSAAINTFRDKYGVLPGDIVNPNIRIPNCNVAPCSTPGDGNGILSATEGANLFSQLFAADLIAQLTPDGTTGFLALNGAGLPNLPLAPTGNNGNYLIVSNPGINGSVCTTSVGGAVTSGIYLKLQPRSCAGGQTALMPSQAYRIDNKLDDGNPTTGSAIGISNTGRCGDATGYFESNATVECSLWIKLMGQ